MSDRLSKDPLGRRPKEWMTLKRFIRMNRREFERHPESSNPEHKPTRVDIEQEVFEIAVVAARALIRDGCNRREYGN